MLLSTCGAVLASRRQSCCQSMRMLQAQAALLPVMHSLLTSMQLTALPHRQQLCSTNNQLQPHLHHQANAAALRNTSMLATSHALMARSQICNTAICA